MRFFVRNLSRFSIRCGSVKRSFDLLYAHPLHFFSFPAYSSPRPIFLGEKEREREKSKLCIFHRLKHSEFETPQCKISHSIIENDHHHSSVGLNSQKSCQKVKKKLKGEWPIRRKWSLASLKSQFGSLKMSPQRCSKNLVKNIWRCAA